MQFRTVIPPDLACGGIPYVFDSTAQLYDFCGQSIETVQNSTYTLLNLTSQTLN